MEAERYMGLPVMDQLVLCELSALACGVALSLIMRSFSTQLTYAYINYV